MARPQNLLIAYPSLAHGQPAAHPRLTRGMPVAYAVVHAHGTPAACPSHNRDLPMTFPEDTQRPPAPRPRPTHRLPMSLPRPARGFRAARPRPARGQTAAYRVSNWKSRWRAQKCHLVSTWRPRFHAGQRRSPSRAQEAPRARRGLVTRLPWGLDGRPLSGPRGPPRRRGAVAPAWSLVALFVRRGRRLRPSEGEDMNSHAVAHFTWRPSRATLATIRGHATARPTLSLLGGA